MKQYTAKQQIDALKKGEYLDENECYYFYDWFCKDESLKNKSKGLMAKAVKFAKKMNINLDTHYIWFKNNCPLGGRLYDDFRFAEVETGNTIWTVSPCEGWNGRAEAYGTINKFQTPILEGNTWTEMMSCEVPLREDSV
jgi:hypothetical protein